MVDMEKGGCKNATKKIDGVCSVVLYSERERRLTVRKRTPRLVTFPLTTDAIISHPAILTSVFMDGPGTRWSNIIL